METVTFKSRPLLTFHHDVSPIRFDRNGLYVTSNKEHIEILRKNTDEVVELGEDELTETGTETTTTKEEPANEDPTVEQPDGIREVTEEVNDVSLSEIGIPATSIPKLVEAGVTVAHLFGKTKEELKAIDGIGEKTAETILSYFAKK